MLESADLLGYGLKQNFFIIGGGVAGLSAAYELLQRGHGVRLANAGRAGQSSWAGAGILCPLLPWNYGEDVNRLALEGMESWPDWAAAIAKTSNKDPEYWACGMEIRADGLEAALAWCRQHHLPAEMTTGRLWLPGVGQVRNPRIIAALSGAITAMGGEILTDCEISQVNRDGRMALTVASGQTEYTADAYIWAGGAWAAQALGPMAPVPHIRPVRGQMLLYAPGSHSLKHIIYRNGLYLVPRRDGHLLAGSTTEDAGFDARTTAEALQQLHEAACELLPELGGHQPIRSWAGLRPGSPDNIPVIDRHPDFDNVWVHAGHFRYGVTMAPASSRLLTELMLGQAPHLDPAPYSWAAAQARRWGSSAAC